jgi:hypothetical protein
MTVQEAQRHYIILKTFQTMRQRAYDQALSLSSEADDRVTEFENQCQKELGIDPRVYWRTKGAEAEIKELCDLMETASK